MKYRLNLGFFCRILEFLSSESGFSSSRFGFFGFWGIETETDPLELVYGGENLPSTVGIVESASFRLVLVGSSWWVGSRMGLDRPKCACEMHE